jgi:hypothetical protein
MAELYFSDPDHMRTVFTSDYVRTVVGPDCEAFSDFGAANAMLSGGDIVILGNDTTEGIDPALVANYFVETNGTIAAGTEFVACVKPILLDCIKKLGSDQVSKVVFTTRIPDSANILKHFGGDAASPNYSRPSRCTSSLCTAFQLSGTYKEHLRRLQVCTWSVEASSSRLKTARCCLACQGESSLI